MDDTKPNNSVGAYELKTHLADILDRVEAGETILVTRHGRTVGHIAPTIKKKDVAKIQAAINEIKAARKGHTLGPDLTWKDLRDEGRKY